MQIPENKNSIKIGGEEVTLDSSILLFDESNINSFMEKLSLWYDYFSSKLAEAEYIQAMKEHEYEVLYSDAYEKFKDQGCTDKLAEANAKKYEPVVSAKKDVIVSKYKVTLLKQHIKAWDKAHENAQSRGHMLRKEMDKLNVDIVSKKEINDYVDNIVRK